MTGVEATGRAARIAERLEAAWTGGAALEPLRETDDLNDVEDAYAVQQAWTELRVAAGERIVGRKIGLTSRAVQEQMGVDEPDYGTLWASRWFHAPGGRAEVPAATFLQPRVEGELAFLLGELPDTPVVTVQQVIAATEAVAPAIEIVDSRIADWRIALPDTVADNASYGGFAVGPWSRRLRDCDLRTLGMTLGRPGEPAVFGTGAAALGHPARAVAWLATKLTSLGVRIEPGDVVLSGALAPMAPAVAGDRFVLEVHGAAPLVLAFE